MWVLRFARCLASAFWRLPPGGLGAPSLEAAAPHLCFVRSWSLELFELWRLLSPPNLHPPSTASPSAIPPVSQHRVTTSPTTFLSCTQARQEFRRRVDCEIPAPSIFSGPRATREDRHQVESIARSLLRACWPGKQDVEEARAVEPNHRILEIDVIPRHLIYSH